MFFHKHWLKLHITTAVITLLISFKVFFIFVLSPLILGFVSYGIFNALGHKGSSAVTNKFINFLSAGEGSHNVHHDNPKKIRLSKGDISGYVVEKYFI